jgi:hypothetical protein
VSQLWVTFGSRCIRRGLDEPTCLKFPPGGLELRLVLHPVGASIVGIGPPAFGSQARRASGNTTGNPVADELTAVIEIEEQALIEEILIHPRVEARTKPFCIGLPAAT